MPEAREAGAGSKAALPPSRPTKTKSSGPLTFVKRLLAKLKNDKSRTGRQSKKAKQDGSRAAQTGTSSSRGQTHLAVSPRKTTAGNVGPVDSKTWGTTPIPGEPGYREAPTGEDTPSRAPTTGASSLADGIRPSMGTGPHGDDVSTTAVYRGTEGDKTTDLTHNSPKKPESLSFRQQDRSKTAASHWRSRMNVRSRPEEIPRSFEEYRKEYSRGGIDIEEPPEPRYAAAETPGTFMIPERPVNERERQLEVNRMEAPALQLQDNEQFARIVSLARNVFNTKVSMVTIMDEDKQLFLAEVGMGGIKEVDRDVTFCAHTILNENNGFCILDASKDWRFKENPFVAGPAQARFYAGMPIFSPNGLPLGTLCVVDDNPRERFTLAERRRLAEFSELVSGEIERYHNTRQQERLAQMNQSFQTFHRQIGAPKTLQAPELGFAPSDSRSNLFTLQSDMADEDLPPALPSKDPVEIAKQNRILNRFKQARISSAQAKNDRSSAIGMSSSTTDLPPPIGDPNRLFGLPEDSPLARQLAAVELEPRHIAQQSAQEKELRDNVLSSDKNARSNVQQYQNGAASKLAPATVSGKQDLWTDRSNSPFDLATSLISQTLILDLVYLLAVEPDTQAVRLVSSTGLPDPPPLFDPTLHIKALRAKHGLLYQNPKADALINGEHLPSPETYASGMLVGVIEYTGPPKLGYVLAGFTTNPKRVFGSEDLRYLQQFSASLIQFIAKESKRLAKQQRKAADAALNTQFVPSPTNTSFPAAVNS